jgi:hypothetical protein
MINDWLRRSGVFARFTVREYVRSGRILVELLAMPIATWLFFWPNGAVRGLDPIWFFSMASVFMLLLSAYTAFAFMRLGNRPQGYVVLSRDLGRGGYLIGLYVANLAVIVVIYLLFSLLVYLIWITRLPRISPGTWLLGSIPLLLNAAIVAALITLIAPLVLPNQPRLLILGLIVLSLGGNVFRAFVNSATLRPLQALLAVPLLPILGGFELAAERTYTAAALITLAGQVLSILVLLGAALLAFERRELILAG